MLDESVVIGLMEASMVGAGLILAMYALIVPIARRIFETMVTDYNCKVKEFEELKNKISTDSKTEELKKLKSLIKEMKDLRGFPDYLGKFAVFTFIVYIAQIIIDLVWLVSISPSAALGFSSWVLFAVATVFFFLVGGSAIGTIYSIMKKEFDEITKKQKELGLKDSGGFDDSVTSKKINGKKES